MATITAENASKIASLPKSEGRHELLHVLEWPPFDEDKYMRLSIHLDFLYDSLMFVVEKGFSWEKTATVVLFADRILNQIKKCESITEILGFYNGSSATLYDLLGERDFKIFTSYIFETVLPHFKLFKYVFTNERQEQIPNVTMRVEPPFESNSLRETKPINQWEYEKQVKQLEDKENERKSTRLAEKQQKIAKLDDQAHEKVRSSIAETKEMDKESIASIIQEVMKNFSLSATESLKFEMVNFREDMEFKLEKTCLPRPQAMGPPPRYTIQQQKVPSGKASKSPKPGSRNSHRKK